MTDNIWKDRFVGSRIPAWHHLGNVFTDAPNATEAFTRANMCYNVIKVPLAGQVETPFGTQLVTVDNRVMILREPTPDDDIYRYFGVAAKEYGLLQNDDIARLIDPLTKLWPVETAGALDMGKTIFLTLDAGEIELPGSELIHQFFLISDTKDGGTSLKVAFTPVRVVCQNTLVSGLKQATISAAMNHTETVRGELEWRTQLLNRMQKAKQATLDTFGVMAKSPLKAQQIEAIFAAAYPEPKKPAKAQLLDELTEEDFAGMEGVFGQLNAVQQEFEYYVQRARGFQTNVKEIFGRINDEYPAIANTAWAAYNAVVEMEDYRNGADSVFASTLFGPRAKTKKKAFEASLAYIGK